MLVQARDGCHHGRCVPWMFKLRALGLLFRWSLPLCLNGVGLGTRQTHPLATPCSGRPCALFTNIEKDITRICGVSSEVNLPSLFQQCIESQDPMDKLLQCADQSWSCPSAHSDKD